MKLLKSLLIIVIFLLANNSQVFAVEVKSDPRVELCSLVFYLAGAQEYSQCRIPAYLDKINNWFGAFRNHQVVTYAKELRKNCGVSYDAVMKAAVLIKSVEEIKPLLDLDQIPPDYKERWQKEKLIKFYELLADFSQKSHFVQFYNENEQLFKKTEASVKDLLKKNKLQEWFDKSFPGLQPEFILIPAYINGPSCYGPGLNLNGKNRFYCILGVYRVNDSGDPIFSEQVIQTVFHEFCHSYTNPLADKNFSKLEIPCNTMFELAKDELSRQAYKTGKILLYESLVRSCTGSFVKENLSQDDFKNFVNAEEKLGFFWIEPLTMLICELRQQNVLIEQGFPHIIKLLTNYAENSKENVEKINKKWQAEEQRIVENSPRIIESSVKPGETGVSSDIATITIKFDRRMLKQWTIIDTPTMPEIQGNIGFDESCRILTLPVKLEPAKNYTLQLNGKNMYGFRDSNGNPLAPFTLSFRTREYTKDELIELEKMRPHIIKLFPGNGAKNVSPATENIIIEFSEPMESNWALVGGGEPFPQINGEISFDSTGKILTVPVKLKPDHDYWLWINSDKFTSFASKKGIMLSPVKYEFSTGK